MTLRRSINALAAALLSILFASAALAAGDIAKDREGRALKGWDTTAYFLTGAARNGTSTHVHRWRGALWRFASERDRDLFAAEPEKYAPQFGGHCANGLSEGHIVHGNPRVWMIVGGKLYVFYAERGRRIWRGLSGPDALRARIAEARRNWERLKPSAR